MARIGSFGLRGVAWPCGGLRHSREKAQEAQKSEKIGVRRRAKGCGTWVESLNRCAAEGRTGGSVSERVGACRSAELAAEEKSRSSNRGYPLGGPLGGLEPSTRQRPSAHPSGPSGRTPAFVRLRFGPSTTDGWISRICYWRERALECISSDPPQRRGGRKEQA